MTSTVDSTLPSPAAVPIGRQRFLPWRFSLRTMLVMMLVAGVVFAWQRDRRRLQEQIWQLQEEHALILRKAGAPNWGIEQLLGPPDTPGQGDIPTAWASSSQDGQPEWLILEYARPVVPALVEVHETYNTGALSKVSAFDADGAEVVLWSGTDPTPPNSGRGVSKIPLRADFKTRRIKVYLDSPKIPGWNEIDTVGLTDTAGATQWPIEAEASSSYGNGTILLGAPMIQSGGRVLIVP